MSDLVKRLRAFRPVYGWPEEQSVTVQKTLGDEAADRIEELEREKADLAIGYARYKELYEAGCKTWRPVFQNLRREALEEAAQVAAEIEEMWAGELASYWEGLRWRPETPSPSAAIRKLMEPGDE